MVRRLLHFAFVLLPSLSLAQTTATFKNVHTGSGYTGEQDTDLSANNPTQNLSAAAGSPIGRISNFVHRPVFRFNLSSIAGTYSSITEVQFILTALGDTMGSNTLLLHEVDAQNSDWVETAATWNTKDGTNAWDGGAGLGSAGYGITLDSESYTTSTTSITFTITGLAAANLVNDFTSGNNPGFVITSSNESSGTNYIYYLTGVTNSGPKLSVTYLPAPEPSATCLLAGTLAVVGLHRKRKRSR